MFDDLDDPNPAPAGEAARAAVAARAHRIRQRRLAAVAGCAALVLAVAGGTFAGLRGEPRDRVAPLADGTPAGTFHETIDPSADPVVVTFPPSPTATPTVSPSAERTAEPTRTPAVTATATPTEEPPGPPGWDQPDGKPGWGGGYAGCNVPDELPAPGGTLPYDYLSATLELPRSTPASRPGEGAIVVRNDGARAVEFEVSGSSRTIGRNTRTGQFSAAYWSDAIPVSRVRIEPGDSTRIRVHVETRMCGDTSADDGPLPPGDYVMGTGFAWDSPREVAPAGTATPVPEQSAEPSPTAQPERRSGSWYPPHATVELT